MAAASEITRSVGASSVTTVVAWPNSTVFRRVSASRSFWQVLGGSMTQPVWRRPIAMSALKPAGSPEFALVSTSLLIRSRQVRPADRDGIVDDRGRAEIQAQQIDDRHPRGGGKTVRRAGHDRGVVA